MPSTQSASKTFSNLDYQRVDTNKLQSQFLALLSSFRNAVTVDSQMEFLLKINDLRLEFSAMASLAHIRHTMDTEDEFYATEHHFYDTVTPSIQQLENDFYEALRLAPNQDALQEKWGHQLFRIADCSAKTTSQDVIQDLQQENLLITEYMRLKATAKIDFQGDTYNLSQLRPLEESSDRSVRREAALAKWSFYESKTEKLDNLFDKLVTRRHHIARKLGYDNYIKLGYNRLLRSDYGPEEVASFREQIALHVVPLAQRLYERQRERIGLDQLHFYDIDYRFPSGNPKPQGDPEWIIREASSMYQELSSETDTFFTFMQDHQLMDLVSRTNKATGGYCTYLPIYQLPFIFSNFNGTAGDLFVLTHEAGHAFQIFNSRKQPILEYVWPTYEACEIHSMSMEFFTWPWMKRFFGEQTDKYLFMHLASAVRFLPYGAAVDAFQHKVYEHPDASPAERHGFWQEIQSTFLPHLADEEAPAFLQKGGMWQQQNHIYASPFYYIDYVLAQICAFQFWERSRTDFSGAWKDYLHLCKQGGSHSFLELVEIAGLDSPFDPACLERTIASVADYLDQIDDRTL